MAHLAIKGHPTRGNEVIELLEMLGGKLEELYLGNVKRAGYYINSNGHIDCMYYKYFDDTIIYTLESFLEKFPYKVGDKVVYEDKRREITNMIWEEQTNTVAYKLDDKLYCNVIGELQLYKEETMEIPEKLVPKIDFNEYCKDKYILDLGNYEIKEENGKTYAVRKQFEYPKTYEECCEVLGLAHEKMTVDVPMHYSPLLIVFAKLLICRDAYWKIAGEQMGLGKPWEPDWTDNYQKKWTINFYQGEINFTSGPNVHFILAFPTDEMCDAFFENFKELIKECINLL